MKCYLIQNTENGLFSSGKGVRSYWKKTGRIFNSHGMCTKHINQCKTLSGNCTIYDVDPFEILEYDMILTEEDTGLVKIWSEWDFGFYDVYKSEQLAMEALKEIDWELEIGDKLEVLMEEGLVAIEPAT